MSIMRMAAIPGNVYPAQPPARSVRQPGEAGRVRRPEAARRAGPGPSWWQMLLAEAYPAIGLMLIVGYLLWVLAFGEGAVTWSGGFSPAE